jgi:bifunctional UDP-N-acetylglucosamine pyrophosphorylase / glucosamine-1-phosphate N-acetyltransferase
MNHRDIVAVIPAAGRGSRLGLPGPKLLTPIDEVNTIWTILRHKLLAVADAIHVVVAPAFAADFEKLLAADPARARLSASVQPEPKGMGDAIFGAAPHWSDAQRLLVVWGDQVHVSIDTLSRALAAQNREARHCTVPVVRMDHPYVEYVFDSRNVLSEIRESREGAVCSERGFADAGTFVLGRNGLLETWSRYLTLRQSGKRTGEINFLPFLAYLAREGWTVQPIEVADANEARGINTPADLEHFRSLYREGKRRSVHA